MHACIWRIVEQLQNGVMLEWISKIYKINFVLMLIDFVSLIYFSDAMGEAPTYFTS